KSPLAIPSGMAPFMPIPNNISVVATAITEPTIRLPATKPWIIWFRFVMNRAMSILELKSAFIRMSIWSLLQSMKNVRNGTTPAISSTPHTDPAPRTELFYNPLLLLERLGQWAVTKQRLRKLRSTVASQLTTGHIDSLELLEMLRPLNP